MHRTDLLMDGTIQPGGRPVILRSERFRQPFPFERRLGLWVDRIGEYHLPEDQVPAYDYRVLGLHQAVLVVEGRGRFRTPTLGERELGPGDAMLVFPEEPHWHAPDPAWRLKWVVWGGPEADAIGEAGLLSPRQAVLRDVLGCIERAHRDLLPIMESPDIAAVLQRKAIILELIRGLHESARQDRTADPVEARVRASLARLRRAGPAGLPVEVLARGCRISPAYYRRIFRRLTGRSPLEFMAAERIATAKRLLAAGCSIAETAVGAGFADPFYFMRCFRKLTGIPPGRFRRALIGD